MTFPIFELVEVNGLSTNPLFNYLKQEVDCRDFGQSVQEKMLKLHIEQTTPINLNGRNIRWNFTKFLVDADGKVLQRFEPTDSQLDIEAAV